MATKSPALLDFILLTRRSQLSRTIHAHHRSIHTTTPCLAQPKPSQPTPTPTSPPSPSPKQTVTAPPGNPNRPHIRARDGELIPRPLSRPLGLPHPPLPGQNTGTDDRNWRQRRDDFASYDRHLARRQGLIKDLYEKNYFRDIGNIGVVHKGKSILAPATPFRSSVALYFPNLRGRTLDQEKTEWDTTEVLKGRVSVVSLYSSEWGRAQCQTFVGEGENAGLRAFMAQAGVEEVAQEVEINVEENALKHGLIRMFMGRLRRQRKEEDWKRYFLVNKGMDDRIKDALGIWNGKVGHVYLLDTMCRVRWAGNGDAKADEKESLVRSLGRLVDEAKGVQRMKVTRQEPNTAVTGVSQEAVKEVAAPA